MPKTVILFGAGVPDGVGGAIAERFASEDLHVLVTGRRADKLDVSLKHLTQLGYSADVMTCDITQAEEIAAVFERAASLKHPVEAVIYNAGPNLPIKFEDLTPDQFEGFWKVSCFGAFLVAKHAMPLLAEQGAGSVLFTGASASLRGRPNFAHFASAKAGLRNLVQALAREYGPKGVHVAHIVIDGLVAGDRVKTLAPDYLDSLGEHGGLDPKAIAETFWQIHRQPLSAWTHEVDLRPYKENW